MAWGNSWERWQGAEGPIFTIGNLRIDLTLLLVGVHTGAMALGAVLLASGLGGWVQAATFTPGDWQVSHLWTLLSYPFVHDIRQEGIWFALEMLMFFWFGREVESVIGRKAFAFLYAALAILPALLVGGLAPWVGRGVWSGSNTMSFAIFLAFCALHPGAQFFFGLAARWVGLVLLGIYSLIYFAGRDWPGLIQFWACSGLAVAWIKQGGVAWPKIAFPKSRKKAGKGKGESARKATGQVALEKVDTILEKISKQGMQSLTVGEKKHLEEARAKLLQKDRPGR